MITDEDGNDLKDLVGVPAATSITLDSRKGWYNQMIEAPNNHQEVFVRLLNNDHRLTQNSVMTQQEQQIG